MSINVSDVVGILDELYRHVTKEKFYEIVSNLNTDTFDELLRTNYRRDWLTFFRRCHRLNKIARLEQEIEQLKRLRDD